MNPLAEMALRIMSAEQLRSVVRSLHVEMIRRETVADAKVAAAELFVRKLEPLISLCDGLRDEVCVQLIAPGTIHIHLQLGDIRKAVAELQVKR